MVKFMANLGIIEAQSKQIQRLQTIIEEYKSKEQKTRDDNIQIQQSMHITVGGKFRSNSPTYADSMMKLENEHSILLFKLDKLTKENAKLRQSRV